MNLRDMTEADLDKVVQTENEAHTYPWTLGNFSDALRSKYLCKIYENDGEMLGYAVMMLAVDEAELLDIAVAVQHQNKGNGYALLEEMLVMARRAAMRRMVLEVRASNAPAIALYRSSGFEQIGLRRDYYPAKNGREDALLMGKAL